MDPDEEFVTYLNPELRKLREDVVADADDYEKWEALVTAAEAQEQGLSRNSSPGAIAAYRGVYDRFLAKFPLFFGYWKKYAECEFAIAGTEASELVYERGVASIPHSVDLWIVYLAFKCETTHEPEPIRELFERGVSTIGIDFMAHFFWDKYIEFEERNEAYDHIFGILHRLISTPVHAYAKYYDRFTKLSQDRPVQDALPSDVFAQYKAEFEMSHGAGQSDAQLDAVLRPRAEEYNYTIFAKTQQIVNKRWPYEEHITRSYFHVTEVDDEQLNLWRRYLDFEESCKDFERTVFLYERCLVALAYYDDFWLRYARWMQGQRNKHDEVRNIYMRASCYYAAIARPQIRLQWALFEEREGRSQIAADIYDAILVQVPDMAEAIRGAANLQRRLHGVDAAVQVYQAHIDSESTSHATKAALICECAKLLWQYKDSPEEARELLRQGQPRFDDSEVFFATLLELEIAHKGQGDDEQRERIKKVVEDLRTRARLQPESVQNLCGVYMQWLVERGTKDVAREWLELDRAVNGA